jgi:MFS family permease
MRLLTYNEREKPSLHVLLPLALVRSVFGFTVGLYLYNYGPVIRDKLAEHIGRDSTTEWNALQWTAAVFAFGIVMEVVLEVPTGAIGDGLGRKRAVLLSLFFRAVYFGALVCLCFADSRSMSLFCAFGAVTTFAISYTLYSGTFVAWVNDALVEEKKGAALSWVLAFGQVFYWTFFLIGCLFGILLWRSGVVFVSYLCGAGVCIACLATCAIFMKENEGYNFNSLRELFSGSYWNVAKRWWSMVTSSTSLFWRQRLILVFLFL